jgi:hypothetical protein
MQTSIGILESWGLRVDVAAHALDRHGYCAGRDEDRLADLNGAFADPEVRAIITTRGGAGAYRIADLIDFDLVRADPKLVVGLQRHHARPPCLVAAVWARLGAWRTRGTDSIADGPAAAHDLGSSDRAA